MNDGDDLDPDVDYFRRGLVFCILFTICVVAVFALIHIYVEV